MTHVWQRLAATVGSGLLVLLLVQCNALKQKPGDKCVSNGKYQCTDPSTALLCQAGVIVAMPCRGTGGCTGTGPQSNCDDDLGTAGEACMTPSGGENYACTVDKKAELVCTAGKWAMNSTCKGPAGCTINGTQVKCDDDFADVGDICHSSASDANYSCTPDKKNIVVCQSNKFSEWEGCLGPKGCYIQTQQVFCDTSVAKEGTPCRKADNHACSDDTKSMLRCNAQSKWAKQQGCPREGCRVKGNEVLCD